MKLQIANYSIIKKISENGPVSVYQAEHNVLKRKTLLKTYSGDSRLVERFSEEARIVADISDDSVVEIYDFGQTPDGLFYIAMEYISGGNFQEIIDSTELTLNDKINYCYKLSTSLAVLHQKGYVHRDLKPENILVDANQQIKITDFGISFQESINRITPGDKLLGTPLYMSPEQINNQKVTRKSDLFSLGIIFYQVTGQIHPFEAQTYGEIFSKILTDTPKSLHSVNQSIPLWFSQLTESLLKKDPLKRVDSIKKVIEVFADNLGEEVTQDKSDIKKQKKSAIPLSLLFLIIIIAFWANDRFNILELITPGSKADSLIAQSDSSLADKTDSISFRQNTRPQNQGNTNLSDQIIKETPVIDSKKTKTTLFINTYPWCKVYLDYKLIDQTPWTDTLEVKPGFYLLGLQNNEMGSWTDSIYISPNKKNIFSYDLDTIFYKLEIKVYPWADVYIDGILRGTTPVDPFYINKKNRILRVTNNSRTFIDTLKWDGNQQIVTKTIDLEKIN